MFRIRTTKTSFTAAAVQIVEYKNRRMIVVKHMVGGNEELKKLKEKAAGWIVKRTKQPSLFAKESDPLVLQFKEYHYVGFRYGLVYKSLYNLCKLFRFHHLRN